NHGVQERGSDHGPGVLAAFAGAHRSSNAVLPALLSAEEPMTTAVGDVAELGDIDVQHRAWVRVFVATDRLTGDPVDAGEPVDPAPNQHRVHRRGRQPQPTADLDRAQPVAPPQPHDLPDPIIWGLVRALVGPAGPIGHPGWAFGS